MEQKVKLRAKNISKIFFGKEQDVRIIWIILRGSSSSFPMTGIFSTGR